VAQVSDASSMDIGGNSSTAWRRDLEANGFSPTRSAAIRAWLFSPAFKLLTLHRWAATARRGGPIGRVVSRILWRWSVAGSASYLSPLANLSAGLILPHPTGIVIGEGVRVGSGSTIYQHVTIGRARASIASYPVVGDAVTIYAGAVIAGGVTVGDGATIAANAVVLSDVPPGATAVGAPARVLPAKASPRSAGPQPVPPAPALLTD
jgi:serine O-acetyltransferase